MDVTIDDFIDAYNDPTSPEYKAFVEKLTQEVCIECIVWVRIICINVFYDVFF